MLREKRLRKGDILIGKKYSWRGTKKMVERSKEKKGKNIFGENERKNGYQKKREREKKM